MKKLYLFTASYPYRTAKEETFLKPELQALRDKFEVVIVPLRDGEGLYEIPKGIKMEDTFANEVKNKWWGSVKLLFKYIFWKLILKEVLTNLRILTNVSCMKKMFIHIYYCIYLHKWLIDKLNSAKDVAADALFYTYWFDSATTALSLTKSSGYITKFVTKAHGFDLYEYRSKCNYIPFRKEVLENIDKVILISLDGLNYLKAKYPEYFEKYSFHPMGCSERSIICLPSNDNVIRIVSCSMIVPIKRVDFILRVIAEIGKKEPLMKFKWTHLGGGPEEKEVRKMCKSLLPQNVEAIFLGNVENEKVFEFYKANCVDLFILLSESEGRPLSVMEAMSCGIPIVATDVGGVRELVADGENGILVSSYASPRQVAEKIEMLIREPQNLLVMRKRSREIYIERANAVTNYEEFAHFLKSI